MIAADTDGTVIRLLANYSDNYRIKEVPGRRFDTQARQWTLPLSWASCVTLRGIFKEELEVRPALAAWARVEIINRITPALEIRVMDVLPPDHPIARKLDELGL